MSGQDVDQVVTQTFVSAFTSTRQKLLRLTIPAVWAIEMTAHC
jgi:hypothetical protein